MKRFEIYEHDYTNPNGTNWGLYPFVVISSDKKCSMEEIKKVGALICRPTPPVHIPTHKDVYLDQRDGLWTTFPCRCNRIYKLQKCQLTRKVGMVSKLKQELIRLLLRRCLDYEMEV